MDHGLEVLSVVISKGRAGNVDVRACVLIEKAHGAYHLSVAALGISKGRGQHTAAQSTSI